MIISTNDPLVREAIYHAYRGRCFYTGQPVRKEKMVIDHLVPRAKDGEDSIYNCVLTFQDANLAKSAKIDQSMVDRMLYIVKTGFASRVEKRIKALQGNAKQKRKKVKVPADLVCVRRKDLFWAEDMGIQILTNSPRVTDDNIYDILKSLNKYIEIARKDSSTSCNDIWLTREYREQINSLWYKASGEYYKIVSKTKYYDSSSPDRWATIFFNQDFFKFLNQLDQENEEFEKFSESESFETYQEFLREFCERFPPPEKYREEIMKNR